MAAVGVGEGGEASDAFTGMHGDEFDDIEDGEEEEDEPEQASFTPFDDEDDKVLPCPQACRTTSPPAARSPCGSASRTTSGSSARSRPSTRTLPLAPERSRRMRALPQFPDKPNGRPAGLDSPRLDTILT